MKRRAPSRFKSSLGDWFEAPEAVRWLTVLVFLQLFLAWNIAQYAFLWPGSTDWQEYWVEPGELLPSHSPLLIVALVGWALVLALDGWSIAADRSRQHRFARVGLFVMLVLFNLIYAILIWRTNMVIADPA